MTTKFNFLTPRMRVQRAIDERRRQHPKKPDNWHRQQALQAAANESIAHELRVPGQFYVTRGKQ